MHFNRLGTLWLTLLPPLLILGLILRLGVDVPFGDEWDMPGQLFERAVEGRLTVEDLFIQQNESRDAFRRLLLLVVGLTLGWHVTSFMVLGWLCVVLTFLVLLTMVPGFAGRRSFFFLPVTLLLSALLFSPSQWESWLFGTLSLGGSLRILCIVLCLRVLATKMHFGVKCAVCAVLSFLSTFTSAPGMVCWLLACPLFRWGIDEREKRPPGDGRRVLWWSALYLVAAVATIGFYFWDYSRPAYHPPYTVVPDNPALGLRYFLAWLGSPFSQYTAQRLVYATVLGTALLGLLLIALAILGWKWRQRWDAALASAGYPWIALTLYGLILGLVTTLGRAGFGVEQALSSRYISHSLWVAIGVIGILYTVWAHGQGERRDAPSGSLGLVLGIVSILTVLAWFEGYGEMQAAGRRSRLNLLTLRLIDLAPHNPLFDRLHPNPRVVSRRARFLIDHQVLEVDTVGHWVQDKVSAPDGGGGGFFKVVKQEEQEIQVSGWASLPGEGVPADWVLLSRASKQHTAQVVAGLMLTRKRPDVVRELENPRLLISGFREILRYEVAESDEFRMFAVDEQNQRLYQLSALDR